MTNKAKKHTQSYCKKMTYNEEVLNIAYFSRQNHKTIALKNYKTNNLCYIISNKINPGKMQNISH